MLGEICNWCSFLLQNTRLGLAHGLLLQGMERAKPLVTDKAYITEREI